MDNNLNPKKYPASTNEVAKMLGISGSDHDLPMASFETDQHAPAGLPVDETPGAHETHDTPSKHDTAHDQPAHPSESAKKSALPKALKTAAPYLAVFAIGIFLYYFFFTTLNFSAITNVLSSKTQSTTATPQETALQQLEQQDSADYQKWINGFYYNVTDAQLLSPDHDNSGNGLTNFEKYLLNLNPKVYDTLNLGQADSQALSNGINPNTGAPLTAQQQAVLSKYIDMEAVMNRLALNSMQAQGRVAGASVTSQSGIITANTSLVNNQGVINLSPTDNSVQVNTSVPGKLEIPDLNISVPIIWSNSTNDFDTDLQQGVIHYPGTAMPGQIGTTYIAGHSSNYIWAKGSYNHIFSTLGKLANNASFTITVTQTNGKIAKFYYVVINSAQYSPTDQAQFQNTGKSLVALSTCWPVGSTAKRLVVFGQLTQVTQ